ncbi:lipid kinase YegS [Pseudoxanthomonas dokdonensis]|uniref:Probable lipid kinase YegS-like n=1 Tax=Pseudoxanthomonas dokdonensis TaxID=344882 RepID=A0A0R0CIM2_9GAMM|nr:lipid kinase YegS [Pseudoxanthomonas dokdonensis]KRG69695.1 lipid kinase [Pseudoxanthomonas dokdonensis]
MPKSHWFLILNGKATDNEPLRDSVQALRKEGVVLDVRVTWEPGDAERYVREALEAGADTVIAAGGDGTINAVGNALAQDPRGADDLPALAVVPLGTANDFAHAAGIPLTPEPALRMLVASTPVAVDALKVEGDGEQRWCINMASGGFGTRITMETNPGLKKRLGGAAYVLTGLAQLGKIESLTIAVRAEGFAWEGDIVALGVGNGRQAGGGQQMCPDALINDGLMDIVLLPEHSSDELRQQNVGLGTLITEGASGVAERLSVRSRSQWLQLESTDAFALNLDGEPIQARRFRIDCVPKRLRMHLPSDSPLLQHSGK